MSATLMSHEAPLKIRPWTMTFVRKGERVVRIDILDTGEIVPALRVE